MTMLRQPPRVLLISGSRSAWTRAISSSVRHQLSAASIEEHGSLPSALECLHTRSDPVEVAVICQGHPDEFSDHDVSKLLNALPLARLIICYGPWCNADGRRRDTWPLAVRVPHHAFAQRLSRELDILSGTLDPLPLTAGRDEIASADFAQQAEQHGAPLRFHIDSSDMAFRNTTIAQLATLGGVPETSPGVDLLLVDLDPWGPGSPPRVHSLAADWQPGALVGISGATDSIPRQLLPPLVLLDKLTVAAQPALLLQTPAEQLRRRSG